MDMESDGSISLWVLELVCDAVTQCTYIAGSWSVIVLTDLS